MAAEVEKVASNGIGRGRWFREGVSQGKRSLKIQSLVRKSSYLQRRNNAVVATEFSLWRAECCWALLILLIGVVCVLYKGSERYTQCS